MLRILNEFSTVLSVEPLFLDVTDRNEQHRTVKDVLSSPLLWLNMIHARKTTNGMCDYSEDALNRV